MTGRWTLKTLGASLGTTLGATVASMALALPVYAAAPVSAAQPDHAQLMKQGKGNGKGQSAKGNKARQSQSHDRHDDRNDRYDRNDRNNRDDHSRHGSWSSRDAAFNGDGRGYWQNGYYYRDGRYYGANCPPGLAKKRNGCLPPGQAKKQRWAQGAYYPRDYRNNYYIPRAYRDRYYDDGRYTYRYYDGYVYQMDIKTFLITRVIQAVLD